MEIDQETLDILGDAPSFACPSCGQQVSKVLLDGSQDAAPSQNHAIQEPAEAAAAGRRSLLAAFWGLNRNIRILGAVALLLLGGLAIFIASRRTGDISEKRRKVHNQVINNEYFTRLIASGATNRAELEGVEDLLPNSSGFIGVSKDKLSWQQARELADRTGGEVLDVTISAKNSRKELTRWLAETYPPQQGSTLWIRDNGKTKVIDCPDVLGTANLDQARRVFLHWPKSEKWKNLGWSWTIQPQFDEVTPFSEWGHARVRVGKLWGVIDEAGKVVQAPAFDVIEPFVEQGSARVSKDGKWGVLDRTGKLLAKPEWEDVQHFINGFIPVKKDGRWGYLDADGKMAIPSVWDDAWRFSPEGFAVVTRAGKRGFIDRSGKVIVEPVWDGAINFAKEGIGMVRGGGGWGLIDTSGKLLSEPKWKVQWSYRRFDLGFVMGTRFMGTGLQGFAWQLSLLGADGALMTVDGYNDFRISDAGVLAGKTKPEGSGDWTLFGAEGKPLIQVEGEGNIDHYVEGLALVRSDRNAGFINMKGEWTVPLRPGQMRAFREGFAASEASGKWGFIDRSGKVAVKQEWDAVRDFSKGYASVKQGAKWGVVDGSGKTVIKPEWDEVRDFSKDYAIVKQGDKWGFVAFSGKMVAKPEWDQVNVIDAGVATVRRGDKWGFVDEPGKTVAEPKWGMVHGSSQVKFGWHDVLTDQQNGRFSGQWVRIFADGRETPVNDLTVRDFLGPRQLPLPSGLVATVTDRAGNYLNRHGDARGSKMLSDETGATVMPDVKTRTDSLDDFIPYATPPKYGLIDATGKLWMEPTWDEARILSADWVWIRVGAKYGLVDKTAKVWIAPAWDELKVLPVDSGSLGDDGKSVLIGGGGKGFLSPWVRVKDGGKVKILRTDGQPAIPDTLEKAEYVDFYGPSHVVIKQPDGQGNWTLSLFEPATGTQVKFPEASTFRWNWNMASVGVIWMKDKATSEWRLMDRKGNGFGHSQPEKEKPDGWGFVQGRGLLHKPDGWVFVDTEIKPISADKWELARDFSEGRAAVRRGGKWGFIGLDGKVLINPVWDAAGDFSRGLAAVQGQVPGKAESRWGYIDLNGKVVIEPVWDKAEGFRQWFGEPTAGGQVPSLDFAHVTLNAADALIDRNGGLIIDPTNHYPDVGIRNGKEYFIIMKKGAETILVKSTWDGTTHRIEGVSPARAWQESGDNTIEPNRSDWTLIDETGKALTLPEWGEPFYDRKADPFAGGLISARTKEQKYGLIHRDGTLVVNPQFDRIAWIAPKVAAVWTRDAGGLIASAGEWIFRDNDKIRIARFGWNARTTEPQFRHGLALIEDVPKWGYARLNR